MPGGTFAKPTARWATLCLARQLFQNDLVRLWAWRDLSRQKGCRGLDHSLQRGLVQIRNIYEPSFFAWHSSDTSHLELKILYFQQMRVKYYNSNLTIFLGWELCLRMWMTCVLTTSCPAKMGVALTSNGLPSPRRAAMACWCSTAVKIQKHHRMIHVMVQQKNDPEIPKELKCQPPD